MLSEHFKNEPSCALKSIERLTSGAIFTSYMYVSYTDLSSDILSKASEPGPGRKGVA